MIYSLLIFQSDEMMRYHFVKHDGNYTNSDTIVITDSKEKIRMYLDLYGFKVAHYHFNPVMTKYMVIDLENG